MGLFASILCGIYGLLAEIEYAHDHRLFLVVSDELDRQTKRQRLSD